MNSSLPLVTIVGQTASGKTALAIKLAKRFRGEVICADSRTVYRGMNIGTAKPSITERDGVPHWGLDLVEPGDRFTAADFKRYALTKIDEIRARGHIPFLVGGTGLYIDGVVFDYQFGGDVDEELRAKLVRMSIGELQEYCYKNNIEPPENKQNKRHLVRAIERKGAKHKGNSEPISASVIVGISTDSEVLRTRIARRIEHMFDDGVVKEANILGEKYGWDSEAMTGNAYPVVYQYSLGRLSIDEAKRELVVRDWRLAKRQRTWFKRNPYIRWGNLEETEHYLCDVLARAASS